MERITENCHRFNKAKTFCKYCKAFAHKACRSRNNYAMCDPNNLKNTAFVTQNWLNVRCFKCLKLWK